ncbi:baseplate assembly protein [Marinomonas atlantica]|uniref:baseplate assembly protein n=1 Tax=Marinomonas atlantica TaxID=1806668 RepID=UPI000836A5FE|nr:baseplate J/gp47 family protein [Marinomonas atlantica]
MSEFTSIDLSQLSAPSVVEVLSYDTILEEMKTALAVELGTREWDMPSEPIVKLLEISAYRELIIRQRVNEAAKQTMLAYASGTTLDHEVARFGVERLDGETDEQLRFRGQLALEGFSTAGPEGAYIFHALSASSFVKGVSIEAPKFGYADLSAELQAQLAPDVIVLKVLDDVGLVDPQPGNVAVNLLSRDGNGVASTDLVNVVDSHLEHEDVRPVTDIPVVRSVEILEYQIDADLYFYDGPDKTVVLAEAISAVQSYVSEQHQNGKSIEISAIYASLHRTGVKRVDLRSPVAPIECTKRQAAYCTAINIADGDANE